MRPVLKPGLRTVWRDATTVQIGLDPERAVVIAGVAGAELRLIEGLDGTRDLEGVHRLAAEIGLEAPRAKRLLRLLDEAGALADAATPTGCWTELSAAERDRLGPDLASLALLRPADARTGGLEAFARRRRAGVLVDGAGRVGAAVAALLAAAGVGHVAIRDEGFARPADAGPAGLGPGAIGRRRADAARQVLRRVAPSTSTSRHDGPTRPDVVVLAPAGALAADAADGWVRAEVAHLYAGVRETVGVVGPLVLPGRSSCLRCADLHRTDRDPGWPAVAAQLAGGAPPAACDVGLATLVAAQATLQVLALLDGDPDPPAVGATLETRLPAGVTRRRPWPAHPACGCWWRLRTDPRDGPAAATMAP